MSEPAEIEDRTCPASLRLGLPDDEDSLSIPLRCNKSVGHDRNQAHTSVERFCWFDPADAARDARIASQSAHIESLAQDYNAEFELRVRAEWERDEARQERDALAEEARRIVVRSVHGLDATKAYSSAEVKQIGYGAAEKIEALGAASATLIARDARTAADSPWTWFR